MNKIGGSEFNCHVTTMSPFPIRRYADVATSPNHTINADQENSIQQLDTSLQTKPRVINFSKYSTLPIYQNHAPTGVDIYSLQRHKIRNHHTKDAIGSLENAERDNYVPLPTHNNPAKLELRPLHLHMIIKTQLENIGLVSKNWLVLQ